MSCYVVADMRVLLRPYCSHLAKQGAEALLLSGLQSGTPLCMSILSKLQFLELSVLRKFGMGDADFARHYLKIILLVRACYISMIIVAHVQ